MPVSLDSSIRIYASNVRHMASFDDDEEVIVAFTWRDGIHEDLKGGVPLTPELAAVLDEADNLLIRQQSLLAQSFPDVFWPPRREKLSREHWWWYLDEGPQVREQAERAA